MTDFHFKVIVTDIHGNFNVIIIFDVITIIIVIEFIKL
jgi:hypothetical protein